MLTQTLASVRPEKVEKGGLELLRQVSNLGLVAVDEAPFLLFCFVSILWSDDSCDNECCVVIFGSYVWR